MFALCNLNNKHHGVYSKGNTPKFSPELGWGAEKSGFCRTKALIYLKGGKIGPIEVE